MSKKKDDRGKRNFKIFLRIYAGILAIASVVVCIVVWNKLSAYQKSYDKSESAHDPDKYVSEFVRELDYDSLMIYMDTYGINLESGFNPQENLAAYYSDCISRDGITFARNEKFKKTSPVYDICSKDTRIAVISLKAEGRNDSFGFHDWTLGNMAFDTDSIKYSSVDIIVPDGATVTYNGQQVPESYIKERDVSSDVAADKVAELGGNVTRNIVYHITDTFGDRKITATDSNGNELTASVSDNNYDFSGLTGGTAPSDVEQRVFEVMDSFILTMNNMKPFEETSVYIEDGSDAYKMLYDAMDSVIWGWTPQSIDTLMEKVTDYVRYSDSIFACSYYGKIHKNQEGAAESGDEEFNYRLVFRQTEGQWYLNYFVIL